MADAKVSEKLELQLDDFEEESSTYGVVVAGTFYAYANVDSWGLIARNTFGLLHSRITALESKPNATTKDEAEYEKVTRQAIQLIVPGLPDEILLRMKSPAKRGALIMDFFIRLGDRHPLMKMLRSQPIPLNGAKSSPVSIGTGRNRTRRSG